MNDLLCFHHARPSGLIPRESGGIKIFAAHLTRQSLLHMIELQNESIFVLLENPYELIIIAIL
jgi:hypothetical protein